MVLCKTLHCNASHPCSVYLTQVSSADTLSELRAVLDREFDQDIPASIENPQKGTGRAATYTSGLRVSEVWCAILSRHVLLCFVF